MRRWTFVVAGLLLAGAVGLIMKQPDLGTALLVLAAGAVGDLFAGLPWKLVLPPVLLGLVGIAADGGLGRLVRRRRALAMLHDYQQQRICPAGPTRDPLGKGFHIIQGMIAIGSGGCGQGLHGGHADPPGVHSRAHHRLHLCRLFRGNSACWATCSWWCAFLFLIWRGLAIAMEAPTLFGRLMAGAVTMIFFTYAFVNMGMVSGILAGGGGAAAVSSATAARPWSRWGWRWAF